MIHKKVLHYNPKLKRLARDLRKNSTLAEVLLWQQIRNRQIKGYKFLRQKPINEYIVDFYCKELMLAVEVDGDTHNAKSISDKLRQKRLEDRGIFVLRFLDIDVKRNMNGVLTELGKCIEELEARHPPGPPQGGNP